MWIPALGRIRLAIVKHFLLHGCLDEVRGTFFWAGIALCGLEEEGESGENAGDGYAETELAVGVEAVSGAAEDFASADTVDAEGGAIACDVLDFGLAGLKAEDGDGASTGFAVGDGEEGALAGDEVLDLECGAIGSGAVEVEDEC